MIVNLVHKEKGDLDYEIINFPDGHKHFKLLSPVSILYVHKNAVIRVRLRDFNDVFILLQVTEVLRNANPRLKINLDIVYLLAARYDRSMRDDGGDSFDLRIVTDIINSQKYDHISVLEPHSNITNALFRNLNAYSPLDKVTRNEIQKYKNLKTMEYDVCFVVPDLGAVKRVETVLKGHSPVNIVYSNKHRNLSTGEILGIQVFNPDLLKKHVIIFDDLCDGGRTFTELAKQLRTYSVVETITLVVTHGLFSKHLNVLMDKNEEGSYVDKIITTNSFRDYEEYVWPADQFVIHQVI